MAIKEPPHVVSKEIGLMLDDGLAGVDVFDLSQMDDGHIACNKCSKMAKDGTYLLNPWFFVELHENGDITTCCKQCDANLLIKMLRFKHSNGCELTDKNVKKGILRCPNCTSPQFAFIKNGHVLCLGCRRCAWQALADLSQTAGGLYVAN